MSESAKILIEAEDKATAVAAKAARNVETQIKGIKEVGGKAKASTEFIGVIANFAGGGQISAFAQQVAGLTEKTSQFAEVSKLGGAGALAFKAGLVAAAGAISFQVGKALGDVVFQTEKWNRELDRAKEKSQQLANVISGVTKFSASTRLQRADLLDENDAIEERKKLFIEATTAIESYNKQIVSLQKQEAGAIGKSVDALFGGYVEADRLSKLESITKLLETQRGIADELAKRDTDVARQLKEAQQAKAVRELVEAEKERLEVMELEAKKGWEIARAFELQKRGVDQSTAADLARREAALRPNASASGSQGQLQALEARLLTRGEKGSDKIVEAIKQLPKSIGLELANQKHNEPPAPKLELEIVGM